MHAEAAPMLDLGFADAPPRLRRYEDAIAVSVNRKGVIDVDTVKGCTLGMRAYPDGGCYGECYAAKIAARNGIAFDESVSRCFVDQWQHRDILVKQLLNEDAIWYRIGVMGDPCHNWNHTINVVNCLRPAHKTAVAITKHWVPLSDDHLSRLRDLDVVVHTSVSGMDTGAELRYRVGQLARLAECGIRSFARVVTCEYGDSAWARGAAAKQQELLALPLVIDNPLRPSPSNPRVLNADILVSRREDSIGGGTLVSLHDGSVFLGHCGDCPDQCGVVPTAHNQNKEHHRMTQPWLLPPTAELSLIGGRSVELRYVKSVLGSGFEADVAALALEDGIAHRAARKNMQIHSAIILLVDGIFAGFFTFQNNETLREFCLLQSVIRPDLYTAELYRRWRRKSSPTTQTDYPAIMTTNPKSKFETPECSRALAS